MATAADLNQKLDTLNSTIATEGQQFLAAIAAKDAVIADLQNQLNNAANGISATDADAIGARIDSATNDVGAIVP